MLERLTEGFIAYMRSRAPIGECQPFNYGIRATAISADARELSVDFVFLPGHYYCCPISGCHHGLLFDADYDRLRACLRAADADIARPMRVRVRVVCQAGALFLSVRDTGDLGPPYHAAKETKETVETYDEEMAPKSPA